ncbi:MAG: hypothetical protein CM15mP120_21100 [Pseudomonadota bacterium]|nr:MAG: hypothetical protein CM15mP120_21100 [Pseudomonadota bacterium]
MVIFGGLHRIARTASVLVPFMAVLYLAAIIFALLLNAEQVPAAFGFILKDAFTGEAAAGGSLLAMMIYGVQRGAYSNEAGVGTESLVHGAGVRISRPRGSRSHGRPHHRHTHYLYSHRPAYFGLWNLAG